MVRSFSRCLRVWAWQICALMGNKPRQSQFVWIPVVTHVTEKLSVMGFSGWFSFLSAVSDFGCFTDDIFWVFFYLWSCTLLKALQITIFASWHNLWDWSLALAIHKWISPRVSSTTILASSKFPPHQELLHGSTIPPVKWGLPYRNPGIMVSLIRGSLGYSMAVMWNDWGIRWMTHKWWIPSVKIRVPWSASRIQWFNIKKSIPAMAGASILVTTIRCTTGAGSVSTHNLSHTTACVSTVLPSATLSCPVFSTSGTACARWFLSNSDGWITLKLEVDQCHYWYSMCPMLMFKFPWQSLFKSKS